MGIWHGSWNEPDDGMDRCRWLSCYNASNGAGALFCPMHEKAPGSDLLREALLAAATLNGDE